MGNASQGSGVCPKCDEIYAEMWELRMRLVDWVRGWGPLSHAEGHARQVLSAKPKQTDYSGCNVTTGNSTRLSPGQAVTCESVPFRHLAHAITAYALNGSDMHIEIKGSAPDPYDPDRPVTLEVCVECLIGKQRNQFSLRSPSRAACHA